jgi:hypothetical protein
LPHLLTQQKYLQFYQKTEGYKILDNGVAEGLQVEDPETLFHLAAELNCQEIVVPDTLGDCVATRAQAEAFKRLTIGMPPFQYMGVVQGANIPEAIDCVEAFVDLEYIRTIGVPRILSNTIHRDARRVVAEYIKHQYGNTYDIHYLGSSRSVDEVKLLRTVKGVRGIDTCMPIVLGIQGKEIDKTSWYEGRSPNFFNWNAEQGWQHDLIRNNCRIFLEWAGASTSGSTL